MGQILPTTPCTSANYLRISTEPHALTKEKSEALDKGGNLMRSVNLNMDGMDKRNDSDGELRPFLNAVLDKFQEVEYKEDALNENAPAGEA